MYTKGYYIIRRFSIIEGKRTTALTPSPPSVLLAPYSPRFMTSGDQDRTGIAPDNKGSGTLMDYIVPLHIGRDPTDRNVHTTTDIFGRDERDERGRD